MESGTIFGVFEPQKRRAWVVILLMIFPCNAM